MPLLWLSISFLSGILLTALQPLPWWAWALAGASAAGLAALEKRWKTPPTMLARFQRLARLPAAALAIALFSGACWFQLAQPQAGPHSLAWYHGAGEYEIAGQVVSHPERGLYNTTFILKASAITPLDENRQPGETISINGRARVTLWSVRALQYGDLVRLTGSLENPAEAIDIGFARYLAARRVSSLVNAVRVRHSGSQVGNPLLYGVYWLRSRAFETILRFFPQPEAGLLAGILLGIESAISPETEEAFRASGLTHLIAISGFNIAVLAGLFSDLGRRLFSRWRGLLFTLLGIAFYTLLAGAEASVIRAAVMGSVGLAGHHLGRRQASVNTLCLTAAVMAAFQPFVIFDIGFQLSFMATLGLTLYAAPLQQGFSKWLESRLDAERARKIAAPVGEYFLFTLAAQLTTLPVLAYHFNRVSLSSILANPLALPAQPPLMILGGAATLLGMIAPPLGKPAALLVWPLIAYTIRVAELFSRLRGGLLSIDPFPPGLVFLFYLLLFGFTIAARARPGFHIRLKPAALLSGMGLGAALIWRLALGLPDGQLHIDILMAGGKPVILARTPTGQTALIDSGAAGPQLIEILDRRLPPGADLDVYLYSGRQNPTREQIAMLFGSHPPGLILIPADLQSNRWQPEGSGLPAPVSLAQGQVLLLDEGITLQILAHTRRGSALLLVWKDFRLLVPGGRTPQTLVIKTSSDVQMPAVLLLSTEIDQAGLQSWPGWQPTLTAWAGSPPAGFDLTPQTVALDRAGWLSIATNGSGMRVRSGSKQPTGSAAGD